MKYDITLGNGTKLELSLKHEVSLAMVGLMVAKEYKNEYFGSCIECKDTNSFTCIAVMSYYSASNPSKTPSAIEIAAQAIIDEKLIEIKNYDIEVKNYGTMMHSCSDIITKPNKLNTLFAEVKYNA